MVRSVYSSGAAATSFRQDPWIAAGVRRTNEGTESGQTRVSSEGKINTPVIQGILKGVRPLERAFGSFSLAGKGTPPAGGNNEEV